MHWRATALLTGMAWLIDDWPEHFHELFAVIQARAAGTSCLQRAVRPLYRVFYADLESEVVQFLHDEVGVYLHWRWWGSICKGNRRLSMPIKSRHPRMTMRQAALAAEVRPFVVRHLIEVDLLAAVVASHPFGRKTGTIHENKLSALCVAMQGAMPLSKDPASIGLPKRRV